MPNKTSDAGGHAGAPMIEAQGLHKRFGATPVLKNVSLTLRQGEVVAVIDLDSPELARFDAEDAAGIETLAALLADRI